LKPSRNYVLGEKAGRSDEPPRWRRTVPVYRLLAGLDVSKDIVWWTPEEIAEGQGVKSHFINTALREGKVLYRPR
jgi:hypothetical protein